MMQMPYMLEKQTVTCAELAQHRDFAILNTNSTIPSNEINIQLHLQRNKLTFLASYLVSSLDNTRR
jgi:hypothetical protein